MNQDEAVLLEQISQSQARIEGYLASYDDGYKRGYDQGFNDGLLHFVIDTEEALVKELKLASREDLSGHLPAFWIASLMRTFYMRKPVPPTPPPPTRAPVPVKAKISSGIRGIETHTDGEIKGGKA